MSSSVVATHYMAGGGGKGVEIMVTAVFFFFAAVVIFVFLLRLRAKWRRGPTSSATRARGDLAAFRPDVHPSAAPPRRESVDPPVTHDPLPACVFRRAEFEEEGIECAVCLSDLVDGETARLLPNCNHGFHLGCIDAWLRSHSTCPICRNLIGPWNPPVAAAAAAALPEAPLFAYRHPTAALDYPTNVLFWGTRDQVSRSGGGGRALSGGDPPRTLVAPLPSISSSATDSSGVGADVKPPAAFTR